MTLSQDLATLTRNEIVDLASRLMQVPSSAKVRKDLLVEYIHLENTHLLELLEATNFH